MNKLGTKLGAIAMSAVMALTFAPSAAITSLAAGSDGVAKTAADPGQAIYGLYNPNSGEHLFTANATEASGLKAAGWQEGDVKWYSPTSGTKVYRLYNANVKAPDGTPLGDHHYTTNPTEVETLKKAGWSEDAEFFYAQTTPGEGSVPVYKLYNPNAYTQPKYSGAHHFTLDKTEKDNLLKAGWTEGDVAFYTLGKDKPVVEELSVSINNTTPKVGDTLVATVVDRNGEDVSDAVSYQWYADDVAIEGATDETLDVTVAMIGSTIKVVATAESGNTFESDETAEVEEADGQIEIESAEAVKANEILVTLAEAVDADDTTIEVTKGTNTIAVEADWSDTYDSVTLTTAANMTNGIYTVTLTSEEDETNTDTESFEVTGRYVKEIVITSDVALTAPTNVGIANPKRYAYAYYDVLDQYGESMRTSASITWSGSCGITANKSTGKLTLEKNQPQDWVYNEQIFVTGVYAKTGVTVQKTLTVGGEQALNSIEMKGFVKKGTTEIIKKLPADFKDGTYYMIFNVLDQNGDTLDAGSANANTVTFVSDNVLVVKELTTFAPAPITVDGVEYDAVIVTPGIKVADGGEVTVTAIANKTGNKTEMNFVVGEDPVVASFKMSAPATTVADGDTKVEIPFEALDEDNNEIKNFVTLAKQQTFNTISFNASEGTLTLAEQDDGTAKLLWSDETKYQTGGADAVNDGWSLSQTTDGIDRPISLTVVVVGGEADNEMIQVSDKRRPDAIAAVNVKEVFTENATITFSNTHTDGDNEFKFYDQYGQIIGTKWGADNGFFAAATAGVLNGTDFAGYRFGIRAIYSGNAKITKTGGTGDTDANSASPTGKHFVMENGETLEFTTAQDIVSVATGEGFKFEIAKFDAATANVAAQWDSVSTSKYLGLTVVDISQVTSFAVKDLNMFYTGALKTAATGGTDITGDGKINGAFLDAAADEDDLQGDYATPIPTATIPAAYNGTDYQQTVKVTGTYNGKSLDVPADFFKVEADKLATKNDGTTAGFGVAKIAYTGAQLKPQDLYDKTTSKGVSKVAEDTLKVTIGQFYGNTTTAGTIKELNDTVANLTATVAGFDQAGGATMADARAKVAALLQDKTIAVGTLTATAHATIVAENADIETLKGSLVPATAGTSLANYQAAFDEVKTANTNVEPTLGGANGSVLDTVSTKVKISDQAPVATAIKGLKDAYTISPDKTDITITKIKEKLDIEAAIADCTVYVVDQYGFGMANATAALKFKAAGIVENPDGYAENNFKTSNNDNTNMSITGAERGDTFSLVLTSGAATATTTMTVGADAKATIVGANNNYRDQLLPVLERQRKAGLN